MLPIAPFSIVNVVAGASHIRWSDFLLGTVIGLLPGIIDDDVLRRSRHRRDARTGRGTFALLAVAVWRCRRAGVDAAPQAARSATSIVDGAAYDAHGS